MSMDPTLVDAFRFDLEPGEHVVWVGQRVPLNVGCFSYDAAIGFFVWALLIPKPTPLDVPGCGMPMVAYVLAEFLLVSASILSLCLGAALGTFLRFRAKRLLYAVTNQRVLIVSGLFSRKVQSLRPGQFTRLSRWEAQDGSGNVALWRISRRGSRDEYALVERFTGVPNVRAFYLRLSELLGEKASGSAESLG